MARIGQFGRVGPILDLSQVHLPYNAARVTPTIAIGFDLDQLSALCTTVASHK